MVSSGSSVDLDYYLISHRQRCIIGINALWTDGDQIKAPENVPHMDERSKVIVNEFG